MTLTESPNVCPAVTTSSSGVQWCTIPYTGSTTHWQLFRYLGTQLSDCGGGGVSTLLVDYVTPPATGWPANSGTSPTPSDWDGNLWPTAASCPAGSLPVVALSMTINVDPDTHPERAYNLSDSIASGTHPAAPDVSSGSWRVPMLAVSMELNDVLIHAVGPAQPTCTSRSVSRPSFARRLTVAGNRLPGTR